MNTKTNSSRKRWVLWAVIAIAALMIIIAAASIIRERSQEAALAEAQEAVSERCEDEVFAYAKYPAGAEFADPVEASIREAAPSQGPEETEFVSVNLGEVHFVNGFGVPSEFAYGCVTYHDQDLEILDAQALAKEKNIGFESVAYFPGEDTLR